MNTLHSFTNVHRFDIGGDNKQTLEDAGAEADLDTQFAFGISYPTPQTFYSTGGLPSQFFSSEHTPSNTNEPYSEWMDYVLNLPDPPQVISTSYGDEYVFLSE